ncbi:MAG: hypothetical protein C4562_01590 [Actinobacteria bacterium]|nr:MAG: hypothetical protein C4562_01590 [Actinomycetota bacterium]
MRKAFVALCLVIVIAFLAGCSGSSEQPAATQTPQPTGTSAASPTDAKATTTVQKEQVPRKLGSISNVKVPSDFSSALDKGLTVLVVIYNKDEYVSSQVASRSKLIADGYDGKVIYLGYEVNDNEPSVSVSHLVTYLKASYLPYLAIIDENKQLVFENSGSIDRDYLNHKLYEVVFKNIQQ